MRAEKIAAKCTASGIDFQAVGRTSAPYDEHRAYLAGISDPAYLFVLMVYMGDDSERHRYRLYLNVLWQVHEDWKPVGRKPEDAAGIRQWTEKNAGLIRRLTEIALREYMDQGRNVEEKARWRARQIGVGERQWHDEYAGRYNVVWEVVDGWDREFRRHCHANQLDLDEFAA